MRSMRSSSVTRSCCLSDIAERPNASALSRSVARPATSRPSAVIEGLRRHQPGEAYSRATSPR
ncbi:MAG: hypothetical protein M3R09_04090, partial [Actinomycetota bacterium]|nr:hypothetical protein [Actinomycetota bacterium]